MKKILIALFLILPTLSAMADDQVSVNINGKSYICNGGGNPSPATYVVRLYCECSNEGGIYLRRYAIMSDGSTKSVSSELLSPRNGSFYPNEIMKKCESMMNECR